MSRNELVMKKLTLMGIGVFLMTAIVTTAHADNTSSVHHDIALEGIAVVEISNSVGSIHVLPSRDGDLHIDVELEGKRKGFFRRKVNVEDIDLEIRERGDTIFLSFEEDNTNASWFMEIPDVEHTIVQLGVGEITMEINNTDVDVEMVVGDVSIRAPGNTVGRINLNVGVGDASVDGADIITNKSAFISRSIRADGHGSNDMEINLGVGDVDIRLF